MLLSINFKLSQAMIKLGISLKELAVVLVALLSPCSLMAQEPRVPTILVLDQSDGGPFYYQLVAGLRGVVSKHTGAYVTIYGENLDLSRFSGAAFEENLKRYLEEKYRDKPIGTVVTIGAATTDIALKWRHELWPGVPMVFAMLDDIDLARLKSPPNFTGVIVKLPLVDSINVARAVVPGLDTIALVGDAWKGLVVYRNWGDEVGTAASGLTVVDLVGLKLSDVRNRVARLPAHSAIIYSAVFSDGEGKSYLPSVALGLIAEAANRPIVVAADTFLAPGGIGGYVLTSSAIGVEVARLVLKILDGASPTEVPPVYGGVKPIFNWKQMQRWNVSESRLPPGSEVYFREPALWETYRWQMFLITAVVLAQAALIAGLLYEHRRRAFAEVQAARRSAELAHVNRYAMAGELTASIAHEINQPLGAILTNTETAQVMLDSPTPDLEEIKEILSDIHRDDQRASEVILRLRSLLKKAPFELKDLDLNNLVGETVDLLSRVAVAREVEVDSLLASVSLPIKGDRVQLQQVIVNLVINAMDGMSKVPSGQRRVNINTVRSGEFAEVSVSDVGPGVPPEKLKEVFEPFFTTKPQGMGMGLSIARTIVEAHGGQLLAENGTSGGATFRVRLPLASAAE
jgi:signal transduction histidine kinase